MKQRRPLKTPQQARDEFASKGLSIAQWAAEHKLNKNIVYDLLAGNARRKCLRGQSHRAAVLLGIKHGELVERKAA